MVAVETEPKHHPAQPEEPQLARLPWNRGTGAPCGADAPLARATRSDADANPSAAGEDSGTAVRLRRGPGSDLEDEVGGFRTTATACQELPGPPGDEGTVPAQADGQAAERPGGHQTEG